MAKEMQRLFFLVRDEPVCDDIEASLIEFGVEEDRIFIYDSLSEDLIALPEHNVWERNRRIPMVVWGIIFGGLAAKTTPGSETWYDGEKENATGFLASLSWCSGQGFTVSLGTPVSNCPCVQLSSPHFQLHCGRVKQLFFTKSLSNKWPS